MTKHKQLQRVFIVNDKLNPANAAAYLRRDAARGERCRLDEGRSDKCTVVVNEMVCLPREKLDVILSAIHAWRAQIVTRPMTAADESNLKRVDNALRAAGAL